VERYEPIAGDGRTGAVCRTLEENRPRRHAYNFAMEVHLTAEKEAQLQQLASNTGRNPVQVVEEAVDRLLEEDDRFRVAVRKGFASLDRGDFIEEEEMAVRVEQMLRRS
jgi:predicted transcriptional regulator